jgi:hypothetical protein
MKIAKMINKDNICEFDFVGLEHWDDLELISKVITLKHHFDETEKLDGIAIRKRVFSNKEFTFILMHDDHVGNYAYCQNQNDNKKLNVLVHQILDLISSNIVDN